MQEFRSAVPADRDQTSVTPGNSVSLERSRLKVLLYRVLDSSLTIAEDDRDWAACLSVILASERSETDIERVWLVGQFSDSARRAEVIDCLDRYQATWIDANEGADECRFAQNGLFVPDPRLLSLVDARADSTADWLMIWPWYCGLPASAERDLLMDLYPANHDARFEALLREPAQDSAINHEPGLVWSGKTLAILPRHFNLKPSSWWSEEIGTGYRAGWALNVKSASTLYPQPPLDNQYQKQHQTPEFHFGICLRSRACTHNWPLTCQNLERTLYNLSRQRCRHFRVWIAVHERPEIQTFGLNVEFVVVNFDPPVRPDGSFGNDKRRKRNAIGRALAGHVKSGFYYMQLDADDLVDISLVQCVLDNDNRSGYLIDKGYIFDYAHGVAARCDEHSVPFWQQCGSCAVLYFKPEELSRGDTEESYFERQRLHEYFFELALEQGRAMTRWVDEAALYLVNHGENHWSSYRHDEHSGRANSKSNFAHRYRMQTPADMHGLFLRYPELIKSQHQAAVFDKETIV